MAIDNIIPQRHSWSACSLTFTLQSIAGRLQSWHYSMCQLPLLLRLKNLFENRGQLFEWLESFIRGRYQSVVVGCIRSQWRAITTGMPQGSVLGPLLCVLFTADVLQIIGEAGVGVQQYDDDTQAYQHCKPNGAVRAFTQLQTTLTKVQAWMSSNRLKLNLAKRSLSGSAHEFNLQELTSRNCYGIFQEWSSIPVLLTWV